MAPILDYLTRPFKKHLALFICFFLLSTSAELYFDILEIDPKAFLFSFCHGFVFSYLLTLIGSILPKKIRIAFNAIFLILLVISCFIDWVCLIEFHSVFDADFVSAMLGTDKSEVSEFIGIHRKGILIAVFILALIAAIYYLCSKVFPGTGKVLSLVMLIAIIPMTLVFPIFPDAAKRIFHTKSFEGKFVSFFEYLGSVPPKIPPELPDLDIVYQPDSLPANIVLIIGESHCKQNCQFYGYDKMTMPLSQQMMEEDSLFVFSNAVASETTTVDSFRIMMSTYKNADGNSVNFWECPSIFHVLHLAGYRESWISNQSKRGLYDNLIGNYAALCDTTVYIGDEFSGMHRTTLDGDMIPVLQSMDAEKKGKNLFIVHLMGNHAEFRERFPDSFAVFGADEYQDHPASQRSILADYDNSLRYTDWVINEVFDMFKDDEAVVVYFPDHGLDLFHTRSDYYLHALVANPESVAYATQIPLLIYVSEKYRNRFPDIVNRMSKSLNNNFRTEDLIYTVMDIANISFKDNDDVKTESLFSESLSNE